MLGLVDSFSDKRLAFLWKQIVHHYWLTYFSSHENEFLDKLIKEGKRKLARKFSHIVTLITLSLSIVKDLRWYAT